MCCATGGSGEGGGGGGRALSPTAAGVGAVAGGLGAVGAEPGSGERAASTITELSGWAMHRSRRIWTRTATKNQLLAQLDRCFPGLAITLPDVLGTRIGRLV